MESVLFIREQASQDVGNVVAFIESDRANFITGQAINVGGGSSKS